MRAVHAGEVGTNLRADDPEERLSQRLVDLHGAASLNRRGRHLTADETRADHVDRAAAFELSEQKIGVRELSKVKPIIEAGQSPRG
jgi:hypothetical protein